MTTITDIRYELGDTSPEWPIMSDEEIQYFITKNNGNLQKSALDTAKTIMLKMSMRDDSTCDVFSIRGTQAAKNYMQALKMYINNPSLNKIYDNIVPYVSGISVSDMQANNANTDNKVINLPSTTTSIATDYFSFIER
jgi:hypothetical protein